MFVLIDKALQEKEMSYSKFAEAIGVSLSAVYEWKKDGYKPKADKLLLISTLLDIPLEQLIKGRAN